MPNGRAPTLLEGLEQWFFPGHPLERPAEIASPDAQPGVRPGLRILVADDNPGNQYDLGELLACLGASVLVADDGAQAVALARDNSIDLVLMDLQMPVLDGLGATMQIRQHERENLLARVAVVAYTSSSTDGRLMRECGFDDVLDKPCSEEALRECIARWCSLPGARPAGSSGSFA
jgi:two-component system, sensor histidine kinase and response regulator